MDPTEPGEDPTEPGEDASEPGEPAVESDGPSTEPGEDSPKPGDLVTVGSDGPDLDGIVFDTPSRSKVVVAVIDRSRGPVFRSVHPRSLSVRTQESSGDRALRLLVRRTPVPVRGGARGGTSSGRGSRGHMRGSMHRTTGK
jgi:hypothetical protein